jgi:tRNA uridine 5-carboxymethylaminomethyl modification enzyme
MFTSRSEFRLALRADNADRRLTRFGTELNLVSHEREALFTRKEAALAEARATMEALSMSPREAEVRGITLNQDGVRRSAFELLSYPHLDWTDLAAVWPELAAVPQSIAEQIAIDAKYAVYLER